MNGPVLSFKGKKEKFIRQLWICEHCQYSWWHQEVTCNLLWGAMESWAFHCIPCEQACWQTRNYSPVWESHRSKWLWMTGSTVLFFLLLYSLNFSRIQCKQTLSPRPLSRFAGPGIWVSESFVILLELVCELVPGKLMTQRNWSTQTRNVLPTLSLWKNLGCLSLTQSPSWDTCRYLWAFIPK